MSADAANGRPTARNAYGTSGESLIRISLPPGTPPEAETAVRRLVELTGLLARRCAQLQVALQSRVFIEQAKGILAERYCVSTEEAFEALRRNARTNRVKLRDLAEEVVASPTTPAGLSAQLDGNGVMHAVAAQRRGHIQVHPRS